MTGQAHKAFDVCGPLPTGTTVLEASAGTGKTFTIAALATRYVAEGVAALSELMLVTFSRAATQELRERVRERLVSAEHGLTDPALARAHPEDSLMRLLAGCPDDEVHVRRRRLARALADFDAATIATTHGFCQQMLAGLGMVGDLETDTTFVEQADDLVREVVDDLYVRKFALDSADPAITYGCARKVARDAMADRQAQLLPDDAEKGSAGQQRYGMAFAVRQEVEARKRTRRLLDYDDLLTRLRDALFDPVRGTAAQERVRSRYRVVLVDEFQDTDPVQWEILQAAFGASTTLVLIGDPKQAIYAFRGADLVTYLKAAETAGEKRTLARNWRSDNDLLTALGTVFGGAALGDRRIPVVPVVAEHEGRRLCGAGPPLRLRVASRAQAGKADCGMPLVGEARALVAEDVAFDIVGLLSGPAMLTLDRDARPPRPGDIAVLVRTNDQAILVRDQLDKANVPAVLTGSKSVFLAPMTREWLTLLRAIDQPHRTGLARAAALTCFMGWTAEALATADAVSVDALGPQLRGWRGLLAERGVAALLEIITSSGGLIERMLGATNGERDLTDIRHIGEALHGAAVDGQLGPAALVEWLQRRVSEAGEDAAEERSRRLESDAEAVQVVTIHGAKGLEFPIVYVPFGWDRFAGSKPDPLRLHTAEGTRQLYVGGPDSPSYGQHLAEHDAEERGEDLRLLYVAMTRAQCQVVAWWAPSNNTSASPLHRLLYDDFPPGQKVMDKVPVPMDGPARVRLSTKAASSAGSIEVESVADDRKARWTPPAGPVAQLSAAVFGRSLDRAWRRTSYSGLTASLYEARHAPGVGSEPEAADREDEPVLPPGLPLAVESDEERLRAVPSPMADLPAGTAFGTLVHRVLETVDTGALDLPTELQARCSEAVAGRLGSALDAGVLAQGMLASFETPLGGVFGGLRLRDIAPADRLAELDFELPLAGGDSPGVVDSTLGSVAGLLRSYVLPPDPMAGYADALAVPALGPQRLRGYLSGSIDAVLRVGGGAAGPRYVVVDYKTNWMGAFGVDQSLTAWDYRPAALAAEMVQAHYGLQALLYSVALHRFLRWRQPGYDPDRHLGGVLYLFLRGMCGPATPLVDGIPCGVFSWRPPSGLVVGLSSLLDTGLV
ncbi:MAG: UvrD-helicase domain-containing protein [Pseudonocardiales bacterium]